MSTQEVQLQFKGAMRRLAASVCIVTAAKDGELYGMAVTAVTSLSMDPPSLLVCVNRSAKIHALMAEGQGFCVNVLHHGQEPVARQFGNAALSATERFSVGDWDLEAAGGPHLLGAQACIECVLDRRFEYGSHTVCAGRVKRVVLGEKTDPLLYANGLYTTAHFPKA
jgi:flavin reductase (DIM6/NTAB) family NADH-FMN oxidoreductase RutF